MHWDATIGISSLLVLLGIAWRVNRTLNKLWDLFQQFPPHRHEGEDVFYPKGMKPEEPQRLGRKAVGV